METKETVDLSTDELESAIREVTPDEAVTFAILLQKNGQLAEAAELYRRVFEIAPDHPRALHFAGVLAHQQGRNGEARSLIERSLEFAPDQADWYNNQGIVLQAEQEFALARDAYRRAIDIDPHHFNAYNNLGVVFRATGYPVEAEAAYREAIRLNPEYIDAYINLGILLNALKRTEEASTCYCKVITLRPKQREARKLLALAHSTLGEIGEAVRIYEEWLREEPGDAIAQHMLAACTGVGVPARASDSFVETTFDGFSVRFEAKLRELSYRAPALIEATIEDIGITRSRSLDILDLGCGTGLCGPLLLPFARRLVGLDLSEGMLKHAREKNLYDELIKGELTSYLQNCDCVYDLIAAADVLVYFGDLSSVLEAAARALRPQGHFILTLEHATGGNLPAGFRLEPHGRYSHDRKSVQRLITNAGMRARIVEAELRMEAGVPVPGLVICASKEELSRIFAKF